MGRTLHPNGTKSSKVGWFRVLGINIDEDLSRALEKLADDSDRTLSGYARWVLRQHVRNLDAKD